MKVFTKTEKLSKILLPYRAQNKIGFIPTMGALHIGHLSLVKKALEKNDCVVVSIFVNPTQFDNSSDLKKYPRTLEKDVTLLETLQGTVYIFTPDIKTLYGETVTSKKYRLGAIASEMEGRHRKGHFDGVATVISLLFKAIVPNNAYFGQKDFQQLQIVKKLVEIEKLPIKVIGCPIVREKNGLAMSSRNKRLGQQQLEDATIISETLKEVRSKFKKKSIQELNKLVEKRFTQSSLQLEYFEIANEKTLKTVSRKRKENRYRAFIAAFSKEVRLIDNMALN